MISPKYRVQTQIDVKDKEAIEKNLEPYGLSLNQAVSIFMARLKNDHAVITKLLSSYYVEPAEYISDSYAKYLDKVQDEAEELDKQGKLKSYSSAEEVMKDLEKSNEED